MKNFLIVSTTGMGDTLWGTPSIRATKKAFPCSGIDLLLQPQWIPLFGNNKNIRHLIAYHPEWYRQIFLIPSLLKNYYDHVLIFHANKDIRRIIPFLRTNNILAHQNTNILPGISENQIVKIDKPVHGIHRRLSMIESLDIPLDGTHMEIFLEEQENEKNVLFFSIYGLKKKEYIYLNIGGSVTYKQWAVNKFILLCKYIIKKTHLSIVIGGGPYDKLRAEAICDQLDSDRVFNTTHCSLKENCILISNSKLLVSSDSGPMHIGYALKVPTIGLFWSGNSQGQERNIFNGHEFCGPLDIDKSLYRIITGSFIENTNLNELGCHDEFQTITVEEVWNKIIDFL